MNIYSHCPRDYVCPFCLVIAGIENDYVLTLQDHIVFKNQQVTAFVSSHHFMEQGTNVLIVPNEHYENIYSLPDSYGSNIQHAKRLIALALKDVYNCDGISSRQHNEPAGNQDVWHYHEHLTPRFRDDNLYSRMKTSKVLVPIEVRTQHARQIKQAMTRLPDHI